MSSYRMPALVATLLALAAARIASAAPPPIEAFGRKPAIASIDINPAGTRLVWIEEDAKGPRIVVHDLASGKTALSARVEDDTKVWRVRWIDDDSFVYAQSFTRKLVGENRTQTAEWQRWMAMDVGGKQARQLLMDDGDKRWVTGAGMQEKRAAKSGTVFMTTLDYLTTRERMETGTHVKSSRKDDAWALNLYEVDIATGRGRVLAYGTPFTDRWRVDARGENFARSDYSPREDAFSISVKQGGSAWRTIYEGNRGCDQMGLVDFSSDGKSLLVLGRACGDDRSKLWSMPLDGSARTVLVEDTSAEVEDVVTDPRDGRVLGAISGSDNTVHWLDADAERRHIGLERSLKAHWIEIAGQSADASRVLVRTESESAPPVYYLVDFAAKKADIVNEAYPLLAGVALGEKKTFEYAARDKYALTAWLTTPPGATAKNLPLVVLPHGGPEARDEPGFDWLAQFLASRGYAVLQPQFRGSTGFGQAHADAGRGQWGRLMQDDVTDGALALIAQGIADPKRVCIVGWSYGGYAALAGATFTPEMYACTVSIAGVSDLPSMLGWDIKKSYNDREGDSVAYWREHIGSAMDPEVIAHSPARAAANVRAPVLLIHGVDDTVVPIIQSRKMAEALRTANKPVELIELPDEDHWMYTKSSSRIRTLTELERFLGKNLGK